MFDLASRYVFVFTNPQDFLLLRLIEEYVNGAEIQIRRIDRTRSDERKALRQRDPFRSTSTSTHINRNRRIFHDAHFYFVCIGQVSKSLERLSQRLGNTRLHKLRSRFEKDFSREIRNDLEHIDARAVGKKKKGRKEVDIGFIQDFRNFVNDELSFNRSRYPVNKASLNKLKTYHREIVQIVHEDYAIKDPKFIEREQRDKQMEAIKKAVLHIHKQIYQGRT